MANPFDSPRILIEEAEENIPAIDDIVKAFFSQQNGAGGFEVDAKSGEKLLYVEYKSDVPRVVSTKIRQTADDLRAALDHAVYASSVSIFGGDPKKTKFLIADTADGIEQEISRNKCKDVHEDIIALMRKEEAHKTGNHTIWALNHFRNRNTHKVVALANASANGGTINYLEGDFHLVCAMNEWRSTSKRLYFARCNFGPDLRLQIAPTVEVRLHESFETGKRPATDFLREAVTEVKRIVASIEAETYRILS